MDNPHISQTLKVFDSLVSKITSRQKKPELKHLPVDRPVDLTDPEEVTQSELWHKLKVISTDPSRRIGRLPPGAPAEHHIELGLQCTAFQGQTPSVIYKTGSKKRGKNERCEDSDGEYEDEFQQHRKTVIIEDDNDEEIESVINTEIYQAQLQEYGNVKDLSERTGHTTVPIEDHCRVSMPGNNTKWRKPERKLSSANTTSKCLKLATERISKEPLFVVEPLSSSSSSSDSGKSDINTPPIKTNKEYHDLMKSLVVPNQTSRELVASYADGSPNPFLMGKEYLEQNMLPKSIETLSAMLSTMTLTNQPRPVAKTIVEYEDEETGTIVRENVFLPYFVESIMKNPEDDPEYMDFMATLMNSLSMDEHPPHDRPPLKGPSIHMHTRKFEDELLRTPKRGERPCANGNRCEGKIGLKVEHPAIAREYINPEEYLKLLNSDIKYPLDDDGKPVPQRECLLCLRNLFNKLFWLLNGSMTWLDGWRVFLPCFYNIVNYGRDEYHPGDCIFNPSERYLGLYGPIVKHFAFGYKTVVERSEDGEDIIYFRQDYCRKAPSDVADASEEQHF